MVIVQLLGGLGNQMFQYAFGRSLAKRRSDELLLDDSLLSRMKPCRRFNLDAFNINATLNSQCERSRWNRDILWTLSEVGFGFFKEVFEGCHHHENLRVVGWWQSASYFEDISRIIRSEFTFRDNYPKPCDHVLGSKIGETDSVCVHIRRTDYLNPKDTRGFVGLDYYEQAIHLIEARLPNPHLFVFSDDISWCRENIRAACPVTFFSSANAGELQATDDLYVMTKCKHFVIANSTFSWWAAWLGQCPEKLVFAPRHWFLEERTAIPQRSPNGKAHDLIPDDWIRV